jgi:MFS family permease
MPCWFSRFHVLSIRNYRLAFLAQLSSQTGVWFRNFAISLVVLDLAGSATALAWVTVAQFAPLLLMGITAGNLADRLPSRLVLQGSNGVSLVGSGFLLIVPLTEEWLPALFGILLLSGTAQAFERPAAYALISEVVQAPVFQSAVALQTIAVSVARFLGPAAAGAVFVLAGPRLCFAANAAGYALVALCLLLMDRGTMIPRPTPDRSAKEQETVRETYTVPVRALLAASAIVSLMALNFSVTVTTMVTVDLRGSAGDLGTAHALNAAGAIAGGMIVSGRRRIGVSTLLPACAILALVLAAAALAGSLAMFMLLSPLMGLALGIYQGVLHTAAQTSVSPGQRGRIASHITMSTFGLLPLGALATGWIIDAFSTHVAFFVGSMGCIIAGLMVAAAKPPRS